MKTHVAYNACLFKLVTPILVGDAKNPLPSDAQFIGYGRHVSPNGNYNNAPVVRLYRSSKGCYAAH